MPLYTKSDAEREASTDKTVQTNPEPYRSPWRRDYARLIHSASFRRLQGKTQVFPGDESDYFRNRLTHSLEVAQIAKSIAIRLNETASEFKNASMKIDTDLVEFAALAHDLGHPPFGHTGEEALDECMKDYGGFEGNAQTLRIVTRLEKKQTIALVDGERRPFDATGKDVRCGLNLTYRSIAALVKYDTPIPDHTGKRLTPGVQKGYYASDLSLVSEVKRRVLGKGNTSTELRTIECSIMDTADDIAYSTYDLEDVLKSAIFKPLELLTLEPEVYEAVATTINKRLKRYYPEVSDTVDAEVVRLVLIGLFEELFHIDDEERQLLAGRSSREEKKAYSSSKVQQISKRLARDGYYRTDFTSNLVQVFLDGIEVKPHPTLPQLHQARLNWETFVTVEVAKNITFEAVIRSPAMQVAQFRGKKIVTEIFNALRDDKSGSLLPHDFREIHARGTDVDRHRAVCDFIAGMTDRYAVEFYQRLFGATGLTVQKAF